MIKYNIEIRKEEGVSFFVLENLQQVYGLLVGQIDTFARMFHSGRQFKTWWRKERNKGSDKNLHELLNDHKKASFMIIRHI